MIGPVEVISESSIGSNLRSVEALSGTATLERLRTNEARLAHAASLLKSTPETSAGHRKALATCATYRRSSVRFARRLWRVRQQSWPPTPRRCRGRPPGRPDRRRFRDLALAVRSHPGV